MIQSSRSRLFRFTIAFPESKTAYQSNQSIVLSRVRFHKRSGTSSHLSPLSALSDKYEDVLPVSFILDCLDRYDVFKLDDFCGVLIDSALLKCEKKIVCEDYPSSTLREVYLRQDLRNRDCFSQNSYFWMLWISFTIYALSILNYYHTFNIKNRANNNSPYHLHQMIEEKSLK